MTQGSPAGAAAANPLAESLEIAGCGLANRVVLAPMAGITTSAFRLHMRAHGVGLVYSEMASAHGLHRANRRSGQYVDFVRDERPIALQLFGDTPEVLAAAASLVLERGPVPDFLDINMGCSVKKVMKTGAGAALLGDPERACRVARAVVQTAAAFKVPVTVKLRSGPDPEQVTAPALAVRLEEEGVAALGLHPRAATQLYHGRADHAVTAAVVRAVSIPVVASGDIDSASAARSILEETGAAAVMVARGVLGNPWLVDDLVTGSDRPRPGLPVVVADLITLYLATIELMGERRAVSWMRKHVAWYLRRSGIRGSVVEILVRMHTAREVLNALPLFVDTE